eukprot:scaffold2363_cov159-Amphora_coffeaeformis.AAC.39
MMNINQRQAAATTTTRMMSRPLAYVLLFDLVVISCQAFWLNHHVLLKSSSSSLRRRRRNHSELFVTADTSVTEIQMPRYLEDDEGYPSVLHSIHVKSILSDPETAQLVDLARQYAAATGRWERPDSERHSTYATCDFPIDEAPTVEAYLEKIGFDDRVWETMSECYGIPSQDMSYLDLFCAKYQPKQRQDDDNNPSNENDDDGTMDSLEAHRDGSLLSFTITLTDPTEFEGGGTFFEALRGHEDKYPADLVRPGGVVRPKRAGDGVFHSGKPLHGADVVAAGERIVLVGFVDVGTWWQREGVLAEACKTWGRMDVAEKRYRRQMEKITRGSSSTGSDQKGWFLAKDLNRWLPGTNPQTGEGRSYISNYCPAFTTVVRRADPTYQRLQRLQAEDRLLRNILLSPEEVAANFADFGGTEDITVL